MSYISKVKLSVIFYQQGDINCSLSAHLEQFVSNLIISFINSHWQPTKLLRYAEANL